MAASDTDQALAGRTIAIPETREIALFANMLKRCGARTLSCPLVAIHDNPDTASVEQWLRLAIERPFDSLILYTGEGVSRLADAARRLDSFAAFVESLRSSQKITRGPKPARALHALGLKSDLAAEVPTTAGMIATLSALDLSRRRVGVQLYGRDPNERLMQFLDNAGADVYPVAPYVYADESEDQKVRDFVEQLIHGAADALAFTSATQVERLFKVARQQGRDEALRDAVRRLHLAAVGPLVVDALGQEGLCADLVPTRSFALRPLARRLCDAFGTPG